MFDREIRDFSTVPRWVTLRTIQKQNVAEHSFFVAIYSKQLLHFVKSEFAEVVDEGELLWWALRHDAPELVSGDTPGPWKRRTTAPNDYHNAEISGLAKVLPSISAQKPDNQVICELVKIANLVDELMFLSIEASLGNKGVDEMIRIQTSVRLHQAIEKYDLFIDNVMVYGRIMSAAENHRRGHSRFLTG